MEESYHLKVALQILGRKIYKNTKKTSLYSQSLLSFIHKTPVVESHPTSEIRDLLWPRLTSTGNTVYFYMSSSLIYILKIDRQASNKASNKDIIEKNHMFVMLWNLSVISHWIFPQHLFYMSVEDWTYYGITRNEWASGWVGRWPPVLCPDHISKTILAMVMKFCG